MSYSTSGGCLGVPFSRPPSRSIDVRQGDTQHKEFKLGEFMLHSREFERPDLYVGSPSVV
jgi:hypothetical protein